tara:strand:- start:965 stop:1297 length:333 start_codon:yes stop_codon:yes gene_type:complete
MQKLNTKKYIKRSSDENYEYRDHTSGFSIVSPRDLSKPIPSFCPVCKFVMNRPDDDECFLKFACCYDCRVRYVDRDRKNWEQGKRPTQEEIRKSNQERNSIPISLKIDDT